MCYYNNGIEKILGKKPYNARPDPYTLLRLYKDKALREKLVSSAHELIRQKYDWKIIGKQLLDVYAELENV